jgi:hypothetical protein
LAMFELGLAMLLVLSVFIFCAHLFDALGEGAGNNPEESQRGATKAGSARTAKPQ